jgi:hypothetical protein
MRSHVVLLARTSDNRYLAIKHGKHYVLPDSNAFGQLDWPRHDAKKLAQKLLQSISYGVLHGTVVNTHKFVATRESYRGVEIAFDDSLWPVLQRVVAFRSHELDRPFFDVKLVSKNELDLLGVESAHMLAAATDTILPETAQSSCASPTE